MHPNLDMKELSDLLDRIERLSLAEQVYLIESIAAGLRKTHLTDHEAVEKSLDEFAKEYVANEGFKAPYPIPAEHLAQVPQCDEAKSTS